MALKKNLPKRSLYRGIPLFTPEAMEEAEPLFRILPDEGFIHLDGSSADIFNVLVVYFFVVGENDCVKVNMQLPVLHIIDAGHDRCP
jgi:hypothetical protein